jgi:hypothetical protein
MIYTKANTKITGHALEIRSSGGGLRTRPAGRNPVAGLAETVTTDSNIFPPETLI